MPLKSEFPEISGKGVYCLVFRNTACNLDVGRLRNVVFRRGYHTYVGSALGPGGLKRLKRHVMLSLMKDKKPRWHVDHLSVSHEFELVCVVYALNHEALECVLAGRIALNVGGNHVPDFGSGDCKCSSHLFYLQDCPLGMIEKTFSQLDLKCATICFS